MRRLSIASALFLCIFVGMTSAADYMYEITEIKGAGYVTTEKNIQTELWDNGDKLAEHMSGSGNVLSEKTEIETGRGGETYINFSKEVELEYLPVKTSNGEFDQRWTETLTVQNYHIGATVSEQYKTVEHLQKTTEIRSRQDEECGGALEANLNANVIGVAHIGWSSKDPLANSKGRHNECGRSVEDLTGVFSIEKFIQLWGAESCGEVSVDWLPCI